MSTVKVITNNTPRDVLYWYELTEKERQEFDYLDTEARQEEAQFFRYRGNVYDLGEFMRVPSGPAAQSFNELSAWHGYASDSFYSGVVVKYVDEFERVIVGTYIA
jgi:hypothetical protein